MEEGRTDTAGCIRPHRPLGTSSARAKDVATTMVDTVGTLRRATEAVWGWVIPHMEALGLGLGLGWAVFCPRRPATAADSNSSVPSAPYGGG